MDTADAFDGARIARERIAEEAARRTGFLDLGGLGLTALPEELFALRHLRVLNLGTAIRREDGSYHVARQFWDRTMRRNDLGAGLDALQRLPDLRSLSLSGTPLADLTPLTGLSALQYLDCSHCPLRGLPASVRNLPSLR